MDERRVDPAEASDAGPHVAFDAHTGKPLRGTRIVGDEQERISLRPEHAGNAIDHARSVHALEPLRSPAVAR